MESSKRNFAGGERFPAFRSESAAYKSMGIPRSVRQDSSETRDSTLWIETQALDKLASGVAPQWIRIGRRVKPKTSLGGLRGHGLAWFCLRCHSPVRSRAQRRTRARLQPNPNRLLRTPTLKVSSQTVPKALR